MSAAKRKPAAKPAAKQSENTGTFRFMKSVDGGPSQHHEPRLALMACCVAMQQAAGFKNCIDIRQFSCPSCEAPGFNTGWGVSQYTCGAEWHHDDEGTCATPCPNEARS